MKKQSTLFFTYNQMTKSPVSAVQKERYRGFKRLESMLASYLDAATIKAPQHVCKNVLDYARKAE